MTTAAQDFYTTLGVSEKADLDEIRKAYRALAKKYHPDAHQGDEAVSERFKEIGEAYSVLSNEDKRKKYDQMRRFGAFDISGSGSGHAGGGFSPGGGGGTGFSFEDLGGLGDIFSSILDRGQRTGGQGRSRGPGRGRDIEYLVEISFSTAVRGGKVSISVPVTEECATCSGSGARPGTGVRACAECGGAGAVSFGQGGFSVNRPCPACMGRGQLPKSPCASCGGMGSVRQLRKLQVSVPEGTEPGSQLRLSGQGERGRFGGEPGDLILTLQVKPHRFFQQEGSNIHVTVPINIVQATLGSKIRVKTVDERHVVLKIPAGTQSGTKFRIRGQGVTKGGRKGDQFVEVKVEVPDAVSEQGQEKMREFAEVSDLRY